MSIPTLALTERQGVIWFVRNPPWHSRWPPASCHALGIKGECHSYLQVCFSFGIFCSHFPWLITDSWAARWWWRSNIRWEANESCCRPFHHPCPCGTLLSKNPLTQNKVFLSSPFISTGALFLSRSAYKRTAVTIHLSVICSLQGTLVFIKHHSTKCSVCVPEAHLFLLYPGSWLWLWQSWLIYGPLKFPAQVVSPTRWQKRIGFEDT